jgi:protein-tyrosine phosphatase
MSYDDLDQIRAAGIGAIVNLCGEYCDLHEIEEGSGFAVYYLPVDDECAPDMAALETALDWVEVRQKEGAKVLVHCRFGVGRTGTFLLAHLMRRGMDFKTASRQLKKTRSNPTNHCQWKLLKSYRKLLET